jgi:hypothetical protein
MRALVRRVMDIDSYHHALKGKQYDSVIHRKHAHATKSSLDSIVRGKIKRAEQEIKTLSASLAQSGVDSKQILNMCTGISDHVDKMPKT